MQPFKIDGGGDETETINTDTNNGLTMTVAINN